MTEFLHVARGLSRGFSLRAAVAMAPSGDKGDRLVAAALVVVGVWLGLDEVNRYIAGERLEAMSEQAAATTRAEALVVACLNGSGLWIDNQFFTCRAAASGLRRQPTKE